MARNGAGTYSLPAGNPVVTGTTISSSVQNTTLSDIATALTGSIAADGQTPVTANIPMNSKKLTGLASATTAGDALAYGQTGMGAINGSTGTFSGLVAGSVGMTVGNSAQAGATTLDWYEEGTFTPQPLAATGTFSGRFTRIGNRVFFDMHLSVTNWNGGSGQISITGLPYTSSNTTYPFFVPGGPQGTTSSGVYGMINPNTATLTLYRNFSTIGASFVVSDATVTWTVEFAGSYQV